MESSQDVDVAYLGDFLLLLDARLQPFVLEKMAVSWSAGGCGVEGVIFWREESVVCVCRTGGCSLRFVSIRGSLARV